MLKFFEGFDTSAYTLLAGPSGFIDRQPGRNGGYASRIYTFGWGITECYFPSFENITSAYIGIALRITFFGNASIAGIYLYDGTTKQTFCGIKSKSDYSCHAFVTNNTSVEDSNGAYNFPVRDDLLYRWMYFTFWVDLSTGAFKIFVDGVQIAEASGTLINTANSYFNGIGICGGGHYQDYLQQSCDGYYDDLYIDTVNNLGTISIPNPYVPISDGEVHFSPASDNYTRVNSLPYNTSSYNYTETAAEDRLVLSSVPSLSNIKGIQTKTYARNLSVGAPNGLHLHPTFYGSLGTKVKGPELTLTSSWQEVRHILENDPDTSNPFVSDYLSGVSLGYLAEA